MTKYLFRIDDVAEEMSNWDNFEKLCKVFKKYKIKPIIAVIPDNKDPEIKGKKKKGWIKLIKDFTIAQHGYHHLKTGTGGLNKLNPYGEFAGLSYKDQYDMIKKGRDILIKKGLKINTFAAPWHSYDKNTIRALDNLLFYHISEGLNVHEHYDSVIWIPVSDWKISKKLIGTRTLTMHAQDITPKKVDIIKQFIKENRKDIISIEEINPFGRSRFSLYWFYFWFRYAYHSPLPRLIKWLKN